jgi:hypothetical protein
MAGEIQLNSVSLATESGSAITLGSAVSLNSAAYASTSEVQGTHTTFSGSHSDTATTINLASVSGISAGDYVVGEGITPGTTVSSVGASSVVISAGLDTDGVGIAGGEPISFYKSTKALSPGLVAGQLCRAWVNFNGTGTVAIRAAYNVASISDNGSGDYTVNFATAMPDANYCVVGTSGKATTTYQSTTSTVTTAAISSSSIQIFNREWGTNTVIDAEYMFVTIFR